jgi:hypothetical protein
LNRKSERHLTGSQGVTEHGFREILNRELGVIEQGGRKSWNRELGVIEHGYRETLNRESESHGTGN